ncbi:hypothetical protein EJ110_NYTH13433 [Nymphaea thermarum]|nr:hypothetical protein EJ110_NYTH13433 [Nymphaea thermarum]
MVRVDIRVAAQPAGVAVESIFAAEGKARAKGLRAALPCASSLFRRRLWLFSMLALDGQHRKIFCGFVATIFSVCMRSTEDFSGVPCVAALLNCICRRHGTG